MRVCSIKYSNTKPVQNNHCRTLPTRRWREPAKKSQPLKANMTNKNGENSQGVSQSIITMKSPEKPLTTIASKRNSLKQACQLASGFVGFAHCNAQIVPLNRRLTLEVTTRS